jgi:hypothetical protein
VASSGRRLFFSISTGSFDRDLLRHRSKGGNYSLRRTPYSVPWFQRCQGREEGRTPDLAGLLVQEILAVQGVPLRRTESRVADYAAEFFFCRAVGYARGSYYIFF